MYYSKFPFNTGFTVLGMSGSATDQGYSVDPDVVGFEINRFVDLSGSVYGAVKRFHKQTNGLSISEKRQMFFNVCLAVSF